MSLRRIFSTVAGGTGRTARVRLCVGLRIDALATQFGLESLNDRRSQPSKLKASKP
jgi:hypothetical protein